MGAPWSYREAPHAAMYATYRAVRAAPPCRCCAAAGIKRLADVDIAYPRKPENPMCFGCADDPAGKLTDCKHGAIAPKEA